MSFRILVIDDDAPSFVSQYLDHVADPSFACIRYLRLKGSYSGEGEYEELQKTMLAGLGDYTAEIASTVVEAQQMLTAHKYDLVYLDGGFDAVLDTLVDLPVEARPKYLIPISGSPTRNQGMRDKLPFITGVSEPDWQTKENLGIATIF